MRLRASRLSLESWPRRLGLPLDFLPFAAAAYSCRLVRSNYTGFACRVRRNSDNTELNIGFNANGDLDTVALLAFVGVGSGFVTTWYDQSLFARHATQPNPANQPRIVNAGVVDTLGARPTVTGSGSQWLDFTGSLVTRSRQVAVLRYGDGTQTTFAGYLAPTGGTGVAGGTPSTPNNGELQGDVGTNAWFPGASSVRRNGVGTASNAAVLPMGAGATVFTWRPFSDGTASSGVRIFGESEGRYWIGPISELIYFPGEPSLTDLQTLERNQGNYYGITIT